MVGFAQNCEAALPEGKRIYLRSDSAAYQAAVINRYNQGGRSFTITAALNPSPNGGVIHPQVSLLEELLDLAIGKRVAVFHQPLAGLRA